MVVFPSNSSVKETAMAFKEYDKNPAFLDIELKALHNFGFKFSP